MSTISTAEQGISAGDGESGETTARGGRRAGWLTVGIPFSAVHLGVLGILFVGWSWIAVGVAVGLFAVRNLAITVFYHRGLTHRGFSVGRGTQAAGAIVAASAAQRGPLWWVAHHRTHHRHTDREGDPHSPTVDGLAWSHVLWMFSKRHAGTDQSLVTDLAQYRELRLLDRYHHVAPALLAASTLAVGTVLGHLAPSTGVNGPQLLVWGFCVSTVALWHTTFAVNSLGHRIGHRRFSTRDDSHNLWWLALITMGEGWHNNHHRFPASARHGLARWELDPSWWAIRTMAALRIVRDIRQAPSQRLMPPVRT